MAGAPRVMVKVVAWLPVPVALVADTVLLYVPTVVGVPEINPVLVLIDRPGGKPDAA